METQQEYLKSEDAKEREEVIENKGRQGKKVETEKRF